MWISEQTAIISLYNINWLVCVRDGVCLLRGTDWVFIYEYIISLEVYFTGFWELQQSLTIDARVAFVRQIWKHWRPANLDTFQNVIPELAPMRPTPKYSRKESQLSVQDADWGCPTNSPKAFSLEWNEDLLCHSHSLDTHSLVCYAQFLYSTLPLLCPQFLQNVFTLTHTHTLITTTIFSSNTAVAILLRSASGNTAQQYLPTHCATLCRWETQNCLLCCSLSTATLSHDIPW